MCISCFGNTQPVYVFRTGMLSRCQSQECCIDIPLSETFKITCFHHQRQCRMRTNTQKTTKFFHIFLIMRFGSNLFNSLIITFYFCYLLLIRCHIFIQCFPVKSISFRYTDACGEEQIVDLLLQLLKCKLVIILHPKILFDSIVFAGRDIDRMVTTVAQTLYD